MGECVLWGWRTGLGHHALMEHPVWVDWFFHAPKCLKRDLWCIFFSEVWEADVCCQQKLLGLFWRVIVTCQKRGSSEQDKHPVFSVVSSVLVCFFYLNGYWKFCKKSSDMCQIPHGPKPLVRVMEVQTGMWNTSNTHTSKQSGFLRNVFIIHWIPF